jgi:hypothetical protein
MSRSYTSSPPGAFMACSGTALALSKTLLYMRFQVLTAASMMFRAVFWVVLPCKMIVDSTTQKTALNTTVYDINDKQVLKPIIMYHCGDF